jgi:hypothetical protein
MRPMLDPEIRARITWWKIQGLRQTDPFIKFFMLYMCLDAWITSESEEEKDSKKLDWLINNENDLKKYWEEVKCGEQFQSWLNGFLQRGVVYDMRPKHRGEFISLTNTDNFSQVVRFIYQIRCNLFHGEKSPVDSNDKQLVGWAGNILGKWIEWTLTKTRQK